MRFAWLWLLLLTACDCGSAGLVRVNVRTDYVPGVEFDEVVLSVDGTDYAEFIAVARGDDFVQGVRVAEVEIDTEQAVIRGRLSLDGAPFAQRLVEVTVDGRDAVTLVFTRDCLDIDCPLAGNAAATQCENATCVVPDCSPETPEACDGRCSEDDECAAPAAACAEARCVEGSCFEVPVEARCATRETCLPELGCIVLDEPSDMGMPQDLGNADLGPVDMGPPPECSVDGDCDDGVFCNGAERCEVGTCVSGAAVECDDGVDCTVDSCDEGAGACQHTTDDGRCTDSAGGTCETDGCQYPTCTPSNCMPGPCQTAVCEGDTCQRTSLCSGSQTCCAGACVPMGCDDGNPCTADSCGGSGCVNAPVAEGVTCGASACGPWGPCTGATCASGLSRRSCYDRTCDGAGTCVNSNLTLESMGCVKEQGDDCSMCGECGGMGGRCPGICVDGCCTDIL